MAAVPSIGRASAVEPRPAQGEGAHATGQLYERHSRQIFNFCLHKLGSREEAEDAAQTTFLNAFRGMERGVRPELEQAWLFKIAENVCLTRHRSTFRRRRIESPSDFDALQEVIPSPQCDPDTLIRLPEALSEMSEQQRRALLLREWQGLSYREIGEELDLSQAAVETLLFRARRSLAAALTAAPAPKKRGSARLRSGIDLGSILAAAKAAFAGSAAIKVAAVAAVASTTAIAGSKVENVERARALERPVAATVAKAPAAKAHLQRATSSATPAAPAARHVSRPAKPSHAKVTVVSAPHGVAFVHNRVTDENIGAAAPAPATVPEATASIALAPAAEQPVAYAAARPAPTTTPVVPENAKEHKTFDRGLSTASTPTPVASAAPPTPTDTSAGRTHDGARDHGKRNDRTDRHDRLRSSTPAPATATVAPVAPATAQPATPQPAPTAATDQGKAKWKQNDKRDDRRSSQPTPVPVSPVATPTAVPTTPVATEPTAATPTDPGRKWKDRPDVPAPALAPTASPASPAAAPAPAPSEDKASHRGRGWRR